MHTSFLQVTPGSLRIKIEASWSTASSDYAEACALFRKMPVAGYPHGNAPAIVIASHFSREIRAETIRRCAARLARCALLEKGIRTVGPLLILQATLEPGQTFQCTVETLLRPEVTLPDSEDFAPHSQDEDVRRAEIKEWLLSRAECDVPDPIVRSSLETSCRDSVQQGSSLWDKAAHTALLHVIAHEIADRNNIVVSEPRLEKQLETLALAKHTTSAKLRALYNKTGQLETLRESLLVEMVLDFLSDQKHAAETHAHAAAA